MRQSKVMAIPSNSVSTGLITLQGAWLWNVKDYIDRKFMSMYSSSLDQMAEQLEPAVAAAAGPEALAAVSAAKMRCGGCGGKVRQPCCITACLNLCIQHLHS